jgi:DNA-binding transcriptional regulator YhcF (GntR family)
LIRIDPDNPVPLEEQIAASVRQTVARGDVQPGADLPSVRQLAGDLGVHWNTVARAYRKLSDEGLLQVRRGRGAIVRPREGAVSAATRARLREGLIDLIAIGRVGGLTRVELTRMFRAALASFEERKR